MFALVSRRSLLLTAMAVATAAGGAGLAWHGSPAEGYGVLTKTEVKSIEAIARVLFPPGIFDVSGGDGGTAPMVDALLDGVLDPLAVDGFRYLLRTIELGTIVARGRSFSSLSTDEAEQVLAIWASDEPFPRRLASDSFKVIVGMAFFRRPEVIAQIGWRSGCVPHEEPRMPILQQAVERARAMRNLKP